MNPKLASEFEKVLTVSVSSTVGFVTALFLTESFVHGLFVAFFCVCLFYFLTS